MRLTSSAEGQLVVIILRETNVSATFKYVEIDRGSQTYHPLADRNREMRDQYRV